MLLGNPPQQDDFSGFAVESANLGVRVLTERNVDVRQGSDVVWGFAYSEQLAGATVLNTFVGWTARCQIRDHVGGEVWASVVPTLTVEANKLTVMMHLPASVTEAEVWNDRDLGVYDVELVRDNGSVIPLAAGEVFVTPDVTRP